MNSKNKINKKIKLNIIIPISKKDLDFQYEFNEFKYCTKVGNTTMINFSEAIFNVLSKKFDITLYFITSKEIQKKSKIKNCIKKFKFNKKIIFIKKQTKNVLETILNVKNNHLKMNEKVAVFHPDSNFKIDVKKFYREIKKNYDGIIFGYDNFNPTDHLSSDTGRLSLKKNFFVKKVHEKTILKNNYKTCAGFYYFNNWEKFSYFSKNLLKNKTKHKVTGEIYNLMILKKMRVKYFEVKKFISFSNPFAINEFNFWKKYFDKKTIRPKKTINITNVIPAAGSGKRHKEFKVPKPFINISGKTMILQAMDSMPRSKSNHIIFRKAITKNFKKEVRQLKSYSKYINIINISKKTDGVARTCLVAKKNVDKNLPVLFSSCDFKILYDQQKLFKLIKLHNPDSIIFTFRKYPDARIDPNSYAYVEVDKTELNVKRVVEKRAISKTPHKDFAVTGVFYFKSWYLFEKAATEMIKRKNSVNGEYYVATAIQELINQNKKICNFEIDQFISWSLPIHLKTYLYWEKIFLNYNEIYK